MKKDFDCVDMKRKGAERVREKTKGMTREQEVSYWADRTRALEQRVRARQADEKKSA